MISRSASTGRRLLRYARPLSVWFALTTCLALIAAEPVRRAFHIEAGEASITLRQFATQAAEQVVYPAETVRGVTTRNVQGNFTPLEALGRMLAGTPLVVVKDESTGALSVRREAVTEKNAEGRPAGDRTASTGAASEMSARSRAA